MVLGHQIFKKGLKVDKEIIEVIKNLPISTAVHGVRKFWEYAGFYRRFIKDFA